MKNIYIIIFMFFIGSKTLKAQDLVVSINDDSVECKITKVRPEGVYFTYEVKGEMKNVMLPTSQVKTYKKNFYVPEVSQETAEKIARAGVRRENEAPVKPVKNYQKIRIAVSGGLSYLTAKTSDQVPADFREYYDDLNSGKHMQGEFCFFTNENIGVGLKYSWFNTKNEGPIYETSLVTGQVIRTGKIKDDLTIQYVGPSFNTRNAFFNQRLYFLSSISLGYADYKDDATFFDNYMITGNTVAIALNLGVDVMVEPNLGLGFGLSYIGGAMSEVQIDDGTRKQKIKLAQDEWESISRVDLSIGLRLSF